MDKHTLPCLDIPAIIGLAARTEIRQPAMILPQACGNHSVPTLLALGSLVHLAVGSQRLAFFPTLTHKEDS